MNSSVTMAMSGMATSTTSAAAAASSSASSSMSMDMGSTGDGAACKISMLWNWTTIDACFLSASWHVTSRGMFAASCIGVVFLVVALEFLRRLSKEYDNAMLRKFQRNATALALESKTTATGTDHCSTVPRFATFRWTPLQQLIRAVLHAVTFGVAYIIMLLAMYFNGYIIISIIIGAFLGKFLFDWGEQSVVVGGTGSGQVTGDALETTFCCG